MTSLSQKQNEILGCDGYLLITGGPGSGKTTIAILKAQQESRKLKEYQHILFLSFSNSAVYQIKRGAGINLSKEDQKNIKVQTFHSFCFLILKSYGRICGINQPITVYPPEEEACLIAKRGFDGEATKEQFLRETTLKEGRICFDLFAELTVSLLEKSKSLLTILQTCYPLVIIDEFQDTDTPQWAFINLLGESSKLICLADPKQRIYDFRKGVTSERLNHFRSQFSPTVVDLGTDNYCSRDNEILTAADNIVQNQGISSSQHVGFRIYQYPNQVGFHLKREISEMQKKLINDKAVQSPQICVLTRTNNTASRLSEQLKKKTPKANYTIRHDIILDENKILYVQRFLCTLLDSDPKTSLACISELLSVLSDLHYACDTKTNTNSAQKLIKWKQQIDRGSVSSRATICKILSDLVGNMSNINDGNFAENISQIGNMIRKQNNQYLKPVVDLCDHAVFSLKDIKISKKAGELFTEQQNYSGLKDLIQTSMLQKKIIGIHPLNSNVVIMTMHKSKGKEYDGVIIFDGPHHDTIMLKNDGKEFTRTRTLVRVAMTRARHYVTVLHQENSLPQIFS